MYFGIYCPKQGHGFKTWHVEICRWFYTDTKSEVSKVNQAVYELATQAFTDKFQPNEMEGTTYNIQSL